MQTQKDKSTELLIAMAVFALPFVFVILYTDGLRNPLYTFHGDDEMVFHYPAILKFANQFPLFDVSDYNSATTPLFHIVFAMIGKVVGFEPASLRFVNVLFSYSAVLLLYFLLKNRLQVSSQTALLLSIIFELSPYFFGVSFILLTDNFALLLQIAFFYFYFKYQENEKLSTFFTSIIFLTLTVLTRQTFLYLSLVVIVFILIKRLPLLHKIKLLSLTSLSIISFLIFFIIWEGLTPPSFKEEHVKSPLFNFRSLSFGLAIIGFYSIFFLNKKFFGVIIKKRPFCLTIFIFSFIYILLVPLSHVTGDDGYIWRISRYFPNVLRSSLIFYILIPLGISMLIIIWKKIGFDFKFLALLASLVSNMPNKMVFQKYYDNSIILLLIFILVQFQILEKSAYFKLFLLLFLFILYTITYQVIALRLR